MLTDAIRLLLFPALMAFAASSDLSHHDDLQPVFAGAGRRLSRCSPLVTGMSLSAFGMHLAAGGAGAGVAFGFFALAGSAAATPSSQPRPRSGSASTICSTI